MRGIAGAWMIVAALAASAGAQPKQPDAGAQEKARAHYQEARELHERGEYQRAAAAYLQAFAVFPDPELLFNVGQVYRLAGDAQLAAAYYRRYLELDPTGRAAPEARRHLEALDAAVAAGSAASTPDTPPAARPTTTAAARADAAPGDDDERRRWMRLGGLAAGGVGVVLLGVGAWYGVEARSISAELSVVDRWTAERLARFDDGERAEARAIGFSIAGGALLVGGGVLYWLGRRSQPGGIEVGAAIGPTGEVAVAAGGRF
jgi:tetratricopeptide (TPR) repeat protein